MPDEQPTTSQRDHHTDEATVLDLLMDPKNQRPWTVHELALEMGDRARSRHRRLSRVRDVKIAALRALQGGLHEQ
jgi:hypothetical protein